MRKPRIALDPQAYKALRVWAALEDKDPGDMAGKVILDHMPAKVREAIGELPIGPQREIEETCKPKGRTTICDVKKPKLSADPTAQEKVKEMWKADPRPTYQQIGDALGYNKGTVYSFVQKLIEAGELPK